MYVNPTSDCFDADHMFAFLRGYDSSVMLVVVNFTSKAVDVTVNIPEAAFEYFEINQSSTRYSVKVGPDSYSRLEVSV